VLCQFQTSTGLKGARKLQGAMFGNAFSESSGEGKTSSGIQTGGFGGGGMSFGTSNTIGTSSSEVESAKGFASSAGTSGGNSTSTTALQAFSLNGVLTSLKADGIVGGSTKSIGVSSADLAPIPPTAPPTEAPTAEATAAEEESKYHGKKHKSENKSKKDATAAPTPAPSSAAPTPAPSSAAPTTPAPTKATPGSSNGGSGIGEAFGAGIVTGGIMSNPADGAANMVGANALSTNFGFALGTGNGVNAAGQQGEGTGGGSALGQATLQFGGNILNGSFNNAGASEAEGQGGAISGFPGLFGGF
jgi:hypothetical protein